MLRKFSTTVIKDKSATDQAQIPAAVDIDVYHRGATASASQTVTSGGGLATVYVYDKGLLAVGSTCQVSADSTSNLTVTTVNSSTSIVVRNDGASDVAIAQFSRLVVTGPTRPVLYRDTTALAVLDSLGHTETDSHGYVEFYVQDPFFDYIATSGTNSVLFTDQQGGAPETAWINVTDYDTFQAAVDAAVTQPGATIYVPAGTYTTATHPSLAGGITFTGYAGGMVGDSVANSYLIFSEANTDLITINGSDQVRLENLRLQGAGIAGTGRGLVIKSSSYCHIHNVWFDQFPSWSIDLSDSVGDLVHNVFSKVRSSGNIANGGLRLGISDAVSFTSVFYSCSFTTDAAASHPADISWSQNTCFHDCNFESNADLNLVYSNGYTVTPTFDKCWFETGSAIGGPATNHMVLAKAGTNPAWTFRAPMCVRGAGTIPKLIKSEGNSTSWLIEDPYCLLAGGQSSGTDDLMFGAGDSCTLIGGRVVDTPNLLHASDLQVSATDYAFITRLGAGRRLHVPHVTTTQRDQTTFGVDVFPFNKQKGDIIYNATTNTFQFYGNDWRSVALSTFTGAGAPASGTWSLGEAAYNVTDFRVYICTTAGVAGAGAAFKSVLFA